MVHRQPSLFGVDASEPGVEDLAGLLAGPGRWGRMGGTARISVPVAEAWRVHVLIPELVVRQVPASWEPASDGDGFLIRTAFTIRLAPLVRRWSPDECDAAPARKQAPATLYLSGHALRLWVAAAGQPGPEGYLLGVDGRDEACWPGVGAALQALGLAATLHTPPTAGPAYHITGRRRLARLAELVGDPPPAAPPDRWPVHPDGQL